MTAGIRADRSRQGDDGEMRSLACGRSAVAVRCGDCAYDAGRDGCFDVEGLGGRAIDGHLKRFAQDGTANRVVEVEVLGVDSSSQVHGDVSGRRRNDIDVGVEFRCEAGCCSRRTASSAKGNVDRIPDMK